jgi:hypothetical protein
MSPSPTKSIPTQPHSHTATPSQLHTPKIMKSGLSLCVLLWLVGLCALGGVVGAEDNEGSTTPTPTPCVLDAVRLVRKDPLTKRKEVTS